MKAFNTRQREAIERLQKNGVAWAELLAWIDENIARAQTECARADDEIHIRRLQGEARCLTELNSFLQIK